MIVSHQDGRMHTSQGFTEAVSSQSIRNLSAEWSHRTVATRR